MTTDQPPTPEQDAADMAGYLHATGVAPDGTPHSANDTVDVPWQFRAPAEQAAARARQEQGA
jgi:hypothetical protein